MADFARGERLKGLREARHLSQEDAAHEIGVSVKTVRSWEHGGGIKWDNAKAAGSFYGVDAETLVTRELPAELPANGDSAAIGDQLNRIEGLLKELRERQKRLEHNQADFLTHFDAAVAAGQVPDASQDHAPAEQQSPQAKGAKGTRA